MSESLRIDEVDKYYIPVKKTESFSNWLFWLLIMLSFSQLFSSHYADTVSDVLRIIFLITAVVSFAISLLLRVILIPRAERARRKQNLSNALGTTLSENHTNFYYNNEYHQSILKLGANTFENSLFSKEIASEMLKSKRFILAVYFIAWLLILFIRQSDLRLITWITQFVFSGEVLAGWISLELLRHRHANVYERYRDFFRHEIGGNTREGVATILDIFSDYESAKASAGIKLDTNIFNRLNPSLSKKWDGIKQQLNMIPNKTVKDYDIGSA